MLRGTTVVPFPADRRLPPPAPGPVQRAGRLEGPRQLLACPRLGDRAPGSRASPIRTAAQPSVLQAVGKSQRKQLTAMGVSVFPVQSDKSVLGYSQRWLSVPAAMKTASLLGLSGLKGFVPPAQALRVTPATTLDVTISAFLSCLT